MPLNLPFRFIALDLETTDSDAEIGSIIEIGALLVDENLNTQNETRILIKPLDDQWSERAQEIHKYTLEDVKRDGIPPMDALEQFEDFCRQAGGRPILSSWGNYFDITFLKGYYKRLGRIWNFSHRSLDLKSIALWEMAQRGIPMNAAKGHGVQSFLEALGQNFEGTQHHALDDIYNTIRILHFFRDNSPHQNMDQEPRPGRHNTPASMQIGQGPAGWPGNTEGVAFNPRMLVDPIETLLTRQQVERAMENLQGTTGRFTTAAGLDISPAPQGPGIVMRMDGRGNVHTITDITTEVDINGPPEEARPEEAD